MKNIIYLRDIPITIIRKKIKNMHIHIKPPYGTVVVTAPFSMPDNYIEKFIDEKSDWILSNVENMQNTKTTPEPQYENGEHISVWGEIYTLQVKTGKKYSLELFENDYGENTAVFTIKPDSDFERKSSYILEWYRAELTERVEILLPKWEEYTGLKCSSWQSKKMKTRWGTCNTKTNKIWLNVELAKYPVECLEYVILHELAHTIVPNHGEQFKAILYRYMPGWKENRKKLKERP